MENYVSGCNFSKLKILLGVILNNNKNLSCVIIKKEIIVVNLFISIDGIIKKEIIVVNLCISTDGMT